MSSLFYGRAESALPAPRLRDLAKPPRGTRSPIVHGIMATRREYWLSLVLASTGLASSGYLTLVSLGKADAIGCGGNTLDCSSVLASTWSRWMGMPVSFLAVGLYTVLFATLISIPLVPSLRTRARLQAVWFGLAALAGAAALWFISLQLFVLGKFCTWCLVTHSAGLFLAAIVVFSMAIRPSTQARLAGLAAGGVGLLVAGQLMSPPMKTYEIEVHEINELKAGEVDLFEAPEAEAAGTPNTPPRTIVNPDVFAMLRPLSVLGVASVWLPRPAEARMPEWQEPAAAQQEKRQVVFSSPVTRKRTSLTLGDWPHIGDLESPRQFVELIDYTCPHCRAMHRVLHETCLGTNQQQTDSFGITVLVVPMNSQCNRQVRQDSPVHQNACQLASLALAVWRADPSRFQEYHQWLMTGEQAPDTASARAEAGRLVGADALQEHLNGELVGQYLEKNVELYALTGGGTVPKILFEEKALVGSLPSTEEFRQILRAEYPGANR